ncbi:MAG TPA: response regulator [bacterium]|nr:response regulator [bacterium]
MAETTILIVEPCNAMFAVLEYNLHKRLAPIVRASSATEVRDFFRDRQAVRLVLINTGLPDGDGLTVAAGLKRRFPGMPVLLLSSTVTRDQLLAASQARCNGIIALPCTLDDLLDKVNELLQPESACTPMTFGRHTVLALRGNIPASFANRLKTALHEIFADERAAIIIDLSEVGFFAHQNLMVLVSAACRARQQQGDVVITGASENITRMLDKARVTPAFRCFATRADALRGS